VGVAGLILLAHDAELLGAIILHPTSSLKKVAGGLQMTASQPTIDSAILRLAKERNEARNLAKQLFWALPAGGGHMDEQSVNAAYYSFIKASREWKEGGDD
jgi:hypothetical protein